LPEAISYGIAGILEPALTAPHLLAGDAKGPLPPRPIPELLRLFRSGDSVSLTSGLRAFASPAMRSEVGESLDHEGAWTFLGCDGVRRKSIARLGTSIERMCYARRSGAEQGTLVTVLYDEGWRAGDIEYYAF
jgi:hypothetical protein